MAIAAQAQWFDWRAEFESDREFKRILSILLLLGLLLMWFLATREFLFGRADQDERRYAKIQISGATAGFVGGGELAGGGKGGGNGKGRDLGEGHGGAPKSSLLGVIGSRAGQGAVSRLFGLGGIGNGLDKAMDMVRGSGGFGNQPDGRGSGRSRGFGSGELGDGVGRGGKGIGAVGTGYGSGGDNIDLGVRPNRAVFAKLQQGKASVEGSLDASLIENVVRQNLPGLRYCYEKELNAAPTLAGKVVVQFTIGLTGDITLVDLESSTLKHALAEDCIVRRVKRWRFPRPQGGNVVVSYPFIFSPSS